MLAPGPQGPAGFPQWAAGHVPTGDGRAKLRPSKAGLLDGASGLTPSPSGRSGAFGAGRRVGKDGVLSTVGRGVSKVMATDRDVLNKMARALRVALSVNILGAQ